MNGTQTTRTTAEKIALFRGAFSGRTDVYGTYDLRTGKAFQVKQPVTDQVILRHLKGIQPYGVYPLIDDRTRSLAVDFDQESLTPPMEFLAAARNLGMATYIERSKSKGYHVWTFFAEAGVLAAKARRVALRVLHQIGMPSTEVFPKQDRLDGPDSYGNFINAPLFGGMVPRGRTVFVNEANPSEPYPDQWEFLANIQRVTEVHLAELFESCLDERPEEESDPMALAPTDIAPERSFGLMPCAQRMLATGVQVYQRRSIFRLAVQLRKARLPEDIALAGLRVCAAKNRPVGGKRIITDEEIVEQVRSAYSGRSRSCGCEDPAVRPFCSPLCVLRLKNRKGRSSTTGKHPPAVVPTPGIVQTDGQDDERPRDPIRAGGPPPPCPNEVGTDPGTDVPEPQPSEEVQR